MQATAPELQGCKHIACENMLAINSDECVDCGVGEPGTLVALNRKHARLWPSITEKGEPAGKGS